MAIKTTQRGGATAGRGDQPYANWHPSMGEPKTATGGSGNKPPRSPKTKTGGSKGDGYDYNKGNNYGPDKKSPRDYNAKSPGITKKGNVYNVPDSYWGNR
jgi:hypothetical protein